MTYIHIYLSEMPVSSFKYTCKKMTVSNFKFQEETERETRERENAYVSRCCKRIVVS